MGFRKLSSSFEVSNLLGLDAKAKETIQVSTHYEYAEIPFKETIVFDKAGEIIVIDSPISFNIRKNNAASVQVNPALHEVATVGYETIIAGEVTPRFVLRAHRKGEIELDYLYKVRLFD